MAYIVGQELAALGQLEQAELYWFRALANPGVSDVHGTLAGWELARRRITSRPEQRAFQEGEIWPAERADDPN